MSELTAIYPMLVRVIGVAFAIGGWVYGHKKGYSLFGKSLCGLLAVMLWVLIGGFLAAFVLPEHFLESL